MAQTIVPLRPRRAKVHPACLHVSRCRRIGGPATVSVLGCGLCELMHQPRGARQTQALPALTFRRQACSRGSV